MGSLLRVAVAAAALAALWAGCGPGPRADLEPGEELSGGATTNTLLLGTNAFSVPAANLVDTARRARFFVGNSFFNDQWVTAPSSTTARDGLGPTFNARSCSACHLRDGRGRPPLCPDEPAVALLFRLSLPGAGPEGGPLPDPAYGDQLQPFAVTGVPAEGRIAIEYEEVAGTYGDGEPYSLRRPLYRPEELAFGPADPDWLLSPRVAPAMIGLGLLEALPEEALLSRADPGDADGDGISGRPNWVWDLEAGGLRLGRFGWKGDQPSVRLQAAGAAGGDIGITTALHPDENCPSPQVDCALAASGGTPEMPDERLADLVFYARMLAVPMRRGADEPEVLRGKWLFDEAGCAACHVRRHVTGETAGDPELSAQVIWPYTDLLLHDMGADLADGRPVFEADGREWRTPPLWGIGLIEDVNDHLFLLHDGRARGLAEAVLWHGGEAEAAREAFRAMPAGDRAALVRFLDSL